MYEVVLGLQFLVIVVAVVVFRLWKGVSRNYFISGMLFMTPVPIFRLTAGVGGFIYFADVIGLFCAINLFFLKKNVSFFRFRDLNLINFLVVVLCIVLPILSTFLALLNGGSGDVRTVFLSVFRGVLYSSVFFYFSRQVSFKWFDFQRLMRAQIFVTASYCLFGVGQYFFGYSIDFWSEARSLDGGFIEEGYGGGFMGLYRGAVGAWVALTLAVSVSAIFNSNSNKLLQSLAYSLTVIVCLAGTLIVGSRQGLFFGLAGLVSGTLAMLFFERRVRIRRSVLWGNVIAVMVFVVFAFSVLDLIEKTDLFDWFVARFGLLFGGEGVVDEVTNRDPRFQAILEKVFSNPFVYIFGVGELAIGAGETGELFELIYVDSEILWTLQKIGYVGIFSYVIFFIMFFVFFVRAFAHVNSVENSLTTAIPVLLVGFFLTYGHYAFLHVHSSHAPVAYIAWFLIGSAVSVFKRPAQNLD